MTPEERIWILISKKRTGEITGEEMAELEELLREQESLSFTKGIIDRLWDARMSAVQRRPDIERIWNRIEENVLVAGPGEQHQRNRLLRSLLVAAGVLLIVVSSWLLYVQLNDRKDIPATAANTNQVSTQVGSRSKIELPDGTKVWLNSGSKLTYADFRGGAVREVYLSGEAFFDVVHDEDHPFIIHANKIDIRDIGTSFEVKAYPGEKTVEATLIDGAIEIINPKDPERRILLKPNEKIVIRITDSLATSLQPVSDSNAFATLYTIARVKSNREGLLPETAWVQNKLVFDNEPFGELATKMERWYNVKIYFKDEHLKQVKFSGIIEKETIDQALKAMQFSVPFKYQMSGNDVWIDK